MARYLDKPLPPGAVIGVMGGGQLGRMLSLAASRLGFNCHIYDPVPNGPAARVSQAQTNAPYDDLNAIVTFSAQCDVVTYEFENVPVMSARSAASGAPLCPGARALDIAQNRLKEKTFLRETAGVAVGDFRPINNKFELSRAVRVLGLPCVLKTRRFGYDGKGQSIIQTETDIDKAWNDIGQQPAILEQFIPFDREVSIIAARNMTGEVAVYPLIENIHRNHILHTSFAPALRDNGEAAKIATKILDSLGYIGVMATEFFELENGDLLVNEIAPRVHNSGHWTQNAGCIDQFELHIRAIAGWPLGDTVPKHNVLMTNLLGDSVKDWERLAKEPNSYIHLYGKTEARKGRKMGHVNRIIP